eukprot:TRINITY_DN50747_c0_g1_i1.p1 TRINITY_DN50747_c0_g1~~TRINITY_DN50747_c0_g1_i1.p1  ORF type:complete len:297 (+),score=51.06 TRINITY_DN50747_c0_g1_i1:75-965(+)
MIELISIAVRHANKEIVAELLLAPRTAVGSIKTQIEGIEGTPADNQTLLLWWRPLQNADTLASVGVHSAVTLILVRCAPLLSGRLSCRDVSRLLQDPGALDLAIDAYVQDSQYDVSQVAAIVSAVTAALLPDDAEVAADILDGLPLHVLLTNDFDERSGDARDQLESLQSQLSSYASWALGERTCFHEVSPREADRSERLKFSEEAHAACFRIDAGESLPRSRRERRDRFISCIRTALEVLQHSLEREGKSKPTTTDPNLASTFAIALDRDDDDDADLEASYAALDVRAEARGVSY